MAVNTVALLGGPMPYREAMLTRLAAVNLEVVEHSDDCDAQVVDVALVYCEDAPDPAHLGPIIERCRATVAVLADLDIAGYCDALRLGAGAVYIDTSTEIIVDVARAALLGEALLPLSVAQIMASNTTEARTIERFTPIEQRIAELLLDDHSVAAIAIQLSYSDRTIRRRVQGLYLKLSVQNRAEAIIELRRRSVDAVRRESAGHVADS